MSRLALAVNRSLLRREVRGMWCRDGDGERERGRGGSRADDYETEGLGGRADGWNGGRDAVCAAVCARGPCMEAGASGPEEDTRKAAREEVTG